MSDTTTKRPDIRPADHDERMAVARARAEWELGDASWAGVIIGAYLYPDADAEALAHEKSDPSS